MQFNLIEVIGSIHFMFGILRLHSKCIMVWFKYFDSYLFPHYLSNRHSFDKKYFIYANFQNTLYYSICFSQLYFYAVCIITNIFISLPKPTCTCCLASLGHFSPQKLGALIFGVSVSLRHSWLQWVHFSYSPDSDRKGCSFDAEKV